MKKALILGVTGQDGSYLADILLEKGYQVHGVYRKSSTGNLRNLEHIIGNEHYSSNFKLHRGDMLDQTSLTRIISEVMPDELYNEADQDHVRWSYDMVGYSSDITGAAVAKLFELLRLIKPDTRVFQPCTSNMFGISNNESYSEESRFNPQSPYAIAKTFAYYTAKYYREAYGMHISTGILFNHESPRRTIDYVSRKVTNTVSKIKLGLEKKLVLGDLDAQIDWGYARDYMEAAWLMLQRDTADDFVIGTGRLHSVYDLVNAAFSCVGLNPENYLETSEEFKRPTKTSALKADISKAKSMLNFSPKTSFEDLIELMIANDLEISK